MTDQRECANPDLNEYLCADCVHPCMNVAQALFRFTPSTRHTHQQGFSCSEPLSFYAAVADMSAVGLYAELAAVTV